MKLSREEIMTTTPENLSAKYSYDELSSRRKIANEPGSGWISVKDRLPDPNDTRQKIVFHKRGVSFAYFRGNLWWSSGGRRLDTVTHWMPRPVPPEDVSEDD